MTNRKAQIGFLLLIVMSLSLACSTVIPSSTEAPATSSSNCPALPAPDLTKSGYIAEIILARGTEGEEKNPINLTTVFSSTDTFHAVAKVEDAPENTSFSATWYVTDVGPDIACNSVVDSTEITTFGTRNLDFTLTPESTWPTGMYRVEVFVNGVLDSVKEFSVQ
ncbi:MAG: hypothetical protein AB9891_05120 [Anaerolineaceae bacterium]